MKCLLFCYLLFPFLLFAQANDPALAALLGHWEGAFIKNNSYQKLELEFRQQGTEIFGLQIMEEWHPSFGEFEVPVALDSTGRVSFATGYGKAVLTLDQDHLELVGQLEGFNPSIYVHLKKIPQRPPLPYAVEQVSIPSGDHRLHGHLHQPLFERPQTAIILVGGRGCDPDATEYNLYAKFLRQYGIAVLAYQKQGTGQSTGHCLTATLQDLADDVVEIKKYLTTHPNNYQSIGVLGISAGSWTMTKAEESIHFDFMISIAGPATSVRDQQLQAAKYGAAFYDLTTEATAHLLEYTNLMFDAAPDQKGFKKMKELLAVAEQEQWKQLLESTDVPTKAAEVERLWVRRHDYDPKTVLSSYQGPFLAIYGERDWIVPPQENTALLKDYFSNQSQNLQTVLAIDAEHGMETEAQWVDLGNQQTYWHFYRISPQVRIELVKFLADYGFID